MHFLTHFWRLWNAKQLTTSAADSSSKADDTTSMLCSLQQLCASLSDGQAEVWIRNGRLQVSLQWTPKEIMQGDTGLYFQLNGQNEEVQVGQWTEDCAKGSLENADKQANEQQGNDLPAEEKPSRQVKTLQKMLNYLQLHYAFRYNRLTDRTECAMVSPKETDARLVHKSSDEVHVRMYQPADQRVLNSISLQVMKAGIPCWDRDVKRYVESADIPSYHPFTDYIAHLPQWDGTDRVTALAQRVSHQNLWVRAFHRWMLAVTAQWMDFGNISKRSNSVAPLLVSTQQGWGKSTFCRLLLPASLQAYFTESFDLTNPASAENKLASFGLINLDEFDRLPASRMSQLKNLMQMERLNIRRAYKHSGEPLPRIASFIGTSNRRDLLTDRSGSRRFICVEVERPIDCVTPIEYDQLYAQLVHELQQGERAWFSKEEEKEIQAANEAFYHVTPAEELLADVFEFAEPGTPEAHLLSAAQIYTTLKSKHPAALQDCTPLAFSKLLAQLGKRVHTKTGNGYWVKVVCSG